jgi:hypothetical protein
MTPRIITSLAAPLALATTLSGAALAADGQLPNMLVVKVTHDSAGREIGAEVLPIDADALVTDAASAQAANAKAEAECESLRDAAVAHYYRAARNPTQADVDMIRRHACQAVDDRGFDWRLNRYVDGYQVYGGGPTGRFGAGLDAYYPYGGYRGVHPNYDMPVYGVTYNGFGGPFSPSGYVYPWLRYTYYYYFNPYYW